MTAEDLMFWIEGYATAPATFASVAEDTAQAINNRAGRKHLGATYLRAASTTEQIGDRIGARVFRWLAGLLLLSIQQESRRGQ